MEKHKLIVHHVGSRGGWSDLSLDVFGDDVFFVLYDADADSVDVDEVNFKGDKIDHKFMAVALSNTSEKKTLFITRDPCASGLFPINKKFGDFIITNAGINYSIRKSCELREKRIVDCTTLDNLYINHDEAPDFLSLDTQGSEYDILRGASKLLDSKILGIRAEVEFAEIYKDQKLFDSIFSYLIEKGFVYVGLENSCPTYYADSIDGIRGQGLMLCGDAVFLKDHKTILDSSINNNDKLIKLYKLAATALCFNLLDYAYKILKDADNLYGLTPVSSTSYQELCIEYYREYKKLMQSKKPQQKYYGSLEESDRYKHTKAIKKSLKPYKMLLKPAQISYRGLRKLGKLGKRILVGISYTVLPLDSIEKILLDHGLENQANTQKKARINHKFKIHS